jgi:hypothetical protein
MNDDFHRQRIVAAIDDVRRPGPDLLSRSMAAVESHTKAHRSPRLAVAIGIVLSIAIVAGLVVTGRAHQILPRPTSPAKQSGQVVLPGVSCTLPVRTGLGPGLLSFPSGTFAPAGLAAAQATSYNPLSRTWYAGEPEGISPDRRLVATVDQTKGGKLTLRLQGINGRVLYTRDWVMKVLGWAAGSLFVTTVDTDQLLRISPDGAVVTPIIVRDYAGDAWRFAANNAVWGVGSSKVVRWDVGSGEVSEWYGLQPNLENNSGGGPIFGLTQAGFPIVPDLVTDSRAGVLAITAPGHVTPMYVADTQLLPISFWPLHANSDSFGTWLTTRDGDLYWSAGGADLFLVRLSNGPHVFSFAGACT